MVFRTAGAIAMLLIGLESAAGQGLAQYYPAPQTYPPPAYPPPQGTRPLPPVVDAKDDVSVYSSPAGRPVPPAAVTNEPLPPLGASRDVPPGYREMPQQGFYRDVPPQAPRTYEPAAAGTRPYYGVPGAIPPGQAGSVEQDAIRQDAMRPPLPISPGQIGPGPHPRVTPSTQGGHPRDMAAFPPEVRPETGPKKEFGT